MIIRRPVALANLTGWIFLGLAVAGSATAAWGLVRSAMDPMGGSGAGIVVFPILGYFGLRLISIDEPAPYAARYCLLCVLTFSLGAVAIVVGMELIMRAL